jgi:hypothetical protein
VFNERREYNQCRAGVDAKPEASSFTLQRDQTIEGKAPLNKSFDANHGFCVYIYAFKQAQWFSTSAPEEMP